MLQVNSKNSLAWDFPGGSVVKTLPFNAGDTGSISGQEAKILCAVQVKTKQNKTKHKKKQQYCNKFNEDLKKWST